MECTFTLSNKADSIKGYKYVVPLEDPQLLVPTPAEAIFLLAK